MDFALESLLANREGAEPPTGVRNVFDAAPYLPPLHALRARLLGYYSWAFDTHPDRGLHEATDLVMWRFSAWGYAPEPVEGALAELFSQGLLTDTSVEHPRDGTLPSRMSITATGHAHIVRLMSEPSYRAVEALFTRWYERGLVDEFVRQASEAGTRDGTTLADIVTVEAVHLFDAYLAAAIARENNTLSKAFENQSWVRETLSRSAVVVLATIAPPTPTELTKQAGSSEQMPLLAERWNALPRLPPSLTLAGTVWLPRILWALEFARANNMGELTAAQIAHVLCKHGDIDVPDTNVARAFRDFTKRDDVQVFYQRRGKRYTISSAGTRLISSVIRGAHQ